MIGFALVAGDGMDALVVRRHDLSGCDREGVLRMATEVADAIAVRGVAVPASRAVSCAGTPGIVVHEAEPGSDGALVEVRADVADPTTVVAAALLDAWTAAHCVSADPVRIEWVVPPVR